jgi:hypothetical protein
VPDVDLTAVRAQLDGAPTRDAARDLLNALTVKDLTGLARFCDLWIQPRSSKHQIVDLIVRGTTGARLDQAIFDAANARVRADGAARRAKRAHPEPENLQDRNDSEAWAMLVGEERADGHNPADSEQRARRTIALLRRSTLRRLGSAARTFAPGDVIPIDVVQGYDLDGDIWHRQSSDPASTLRDSWKMEGFDPDQHESAAQGVWLTPYLLENYGPITELLPDAPR